jgi:hypothetical protein
MTYRASLRDGVMTAIFPPVNYQRKINEVIVVCSVFGEVNIYRDIVSPISRIGTNRLGSNNTFNPANRPPIPPGSQVFVVWPSATSATDEAMATITFEGVM